MKFTSKKRLLYHLYSSVSLISHFLSFLAFVFPLSSLRPHHPRDHYLPLEFVSHSNTVFKHLEEVAAASWSMDRQYITSLQWKLETRIEKQKIGHEFPSRQLADRVNVSNKLQRMFATR